MGDGQMSLAGLEVGRAVALVHDLRRFAQAELGVGVTEHVLRQSRAADLLLPMAFAVHDSHLMRHRWLPSQVKHAGLCCRAANWMDRDDHGLGRPMRRRARGVDSIFMET